MLKKSSTDWLLARLARSRNARRKSLIRKYDRRGASPHVPLMVQELECRLVLTAPTITSLATASVAENPTLTTLEDCFRPVGIDWVNPR